MSDEAVGYSVEVTGLSPEATEKDVLDFFAFSGNILHLQIIRSGEYACTAYVTFKDAYSQETACLLSVNNLDTVCCFLDCQDTRLEPRKTQKPKVDLRSSTSDAQSASQKPTKSSLFVGHSLK
ncbi:hypothetical protein L484_021125 [Morus notabilis]|uniref:RRM domain-containing protein n=1 Tax=Morus notabilis TaxID=981085 RepID=W9RQ00_9ROSA|nr:hypothetical protein L484_021125 [Morus notabilis]